MCSTLLAFNQHKTHANTHTALGVRVYGVSRPRDRPEAFSVMAQKLLKSKMLPRPKVSLWGLMSRTAKSETLAERSTWHLWGSFNLPSRRRALWGTRLIFISTWLAHFNCSAPLRSLNHYGKLSLIMLNMHSYLSNPCTPISLCVCVGV